MDRLKLLITMSERLFFMLLHGEKLDYIKSMLFVDYANYLNDRQNFDKATEYYKKALVYISDNQYAYSGLAAIFIHKRLFEEALNYCNAAISITPNVLLFFLQSVIYDSLRKFDMADKAFKRTLNYFNNDLAAAYDRLAYTYYGFKIYDRAEFYCKKALEFSPDEAGLHYNLARIFQAKGLNRMAKEEYQKVVMLTNDKKYRKYAQEEIRNL